METKTYNVTKQFLLNAQIPKESKTYKPMSHQGVIDLTLDSITGAGFKLGSETYTSAKNGNIATGKYTINSVADSEMQLQISWLNSYDKSKRLTWGVGTEVRICMNGMISADIGAFKKKHQGTIQEYAPITIREYVKRAGDMFKEMQKEREAMKSIELSDRDRAILIGRLFLEEELITSTQLNIIARELKIPSFDYNAKDSMWEFYNHLTLSLKEIHPSLYMETLMGAHKFFINEAGIIVPNAEIIVSEPGSHPQADLFETFDTMNEEIL